MSYYWNVVKDMNDSQKLELITLLAESVKSTEKDVPPMKRYTMAEINAMLDEAEADFAAGLQVLVAALMLLVAGVTPAWA